MACLRVLKTCKNICGMVFLLAFYRENGIINFRIGKTNKTSGG